MSQRRLEAFLLVTWCAACTHATPPRLLQPSDLRAVEAVAAALDRLKALVGPGSIPCVSFSESSPDLVANLRATIPAKRAIFAPDPCPPRLFGALVMPDAPPVPRDHVEPMAVDLTPPQFEHLGVAWMYATWQFGSGGGDAFCVVNAAGGAAIAWCRANRRWIS